MPLLRIYTCCGVHRSTVDSLAVPLCGVCRGPMRWKQTRDYVPAAHVPRFGSAPAIDFNQTRERVAPIGAHGVRIDSLHDIRRIEREAERAVANGDPGAEPIVFRKYAQDRSNMDVHTLGPDPSQAPSQDWLRRHPGIREAVSAEVAEALATGATPGFDPEAQSTPFTD